MSKAISEVVMEDLYVFQLCLAESKWLTLTFAATP